MEMRKLFDPMEYPQDMYKKGKSLNTNNYKYDNTVIGYRLLAS
jgi:hypothetical protein